MQPLNEYPVQIENIYLNRMDFVTNESFETKGLSVDVVIDLNYKVTKNDNLRYTTRCNIGVNKNSEFTPFKITLEIDLISTAKTNEDVQKLELFANTTAVFNEIVFARELIRDITSRSKHKQLILPLFDVSNLWKPNKT